MLLGVASVWKLAALCFARLTRTPTTCVLLSGSGRQLRPAEPPGDADADAEDEDSVSCWFVVVVLNYIVKLGSSIFIFIFNYFFIVGSCL